MMISFLPFSFHVGCLAYLNERLVIVCFRLVLMHMAPEDGQSLS